MGTPRRKQDLHTLKSSELTVWAPMKKRNMIPMFLLTGASTIPMALEQSFWVESRALMCINLLKIERDEAPGMSQPDIF